MKNILKIVSVSELIHEDFLDRPLLRLKKIGGDGAPILEPNPCKEFGFAMTGSEIGQNSNGDIIKLSANISSSITVYRKLYKRNYFHMFDARPGIYCTGVIYFNVPCLNSYVNGILHPTANVVALQDEDLLTAMKYSNLQRYEGIDYDYFLNETKQIYECSN